MRKPTKAMIKMHDAFLSVINKHSITAPVYSPELEKKFVITGVQVREMVHWLSLEGFPIGNTIRHANGSTTKAYFWANNYEELEPTLQDLGSRESHIRERRLKLEKIYSSSKEPELEFSDKSGRNEDDAFYDAEGNVAFYNTKKNNS